MRRGRAKRARSEPAADVSRDGPPPVAASWPTHQLAEFLTLISRFNDERTATRRGIEHVAEVLDAEATALVRGGAVLAAVGFADGQVPIELLVAVADGRRQALDVAGAGEC